MGLTLACLDDQKYIGKRCRDKNEAREAAYEAALNDAEPDYWGLGPPDSPQESDSRMKQKTFRSSDPIDPCPADSDFIGVLRHLGIVVRQRDGKAMSDDELTFGVDEQGPDSFQ